MHIFNSMFALNSLCTGLVSSIGRLLQKKFAKIKLHQLMHLSLPVFVTKKIQVPEITHVKLVGLRNTCNLPGNAYSSYYCLVRVM